MPRRAPDAASPREPSSSAGGARVGLISDTHGLLRPEALEALRGCAAIVHAGDIGKPEVLEALRGLAPVTAVRGNNDTGPWARTLPGVARLEVAGVRILVIHDLRELDLDRAREEADAVVAGHSHQPRIEEVEGTLFVNPGSAGPRRFTLPVTVAYLDVAGGRASAALVPLAIAKPPSRTPARTRAARRGSAPPPSRPPRG
jgi:putative phosphoesterase